MAFRATQRPQPIRQVSVPIAAEESQATAQSSQRKRSLADSQEEWVLFSPTAHSVTQTETTSTDRTQTAGLSRFSDFGSLDTGAGRSDQVGLGLEEINDTLTEHASDHDEDADLDSLDDGLHAFQEPSDLGSPRARLARHTDTVLPAHDGMGTFGDSLAVQDHLRQFEKHAGRRKTKRRSSIQQSLSALKEVEELNGEEDRVSRIEHWRLEQSRALLEEIERETRRMRRLSRATAARSRASSINLRPEAESQLLRDGYTTPTPGTEGAIPTSIPEDGPPGNESFWKRITRRVIRDLIGIDENLLSVIFGEELVEDAQDLSSSMSSLPDSDVQREIQRHTAEADDSYLASSSWQERLLERLAKELGILVHQLSEHPGAFSTYMRTQEPPLYAGLPDTATLPDPFSSEPGNIGVAPAASAVFGPSIQQQVAENADPSLWGIEEETDPANFSLSALSEATQLAQEREYWEKELDVNMVFKFLKSRFSSSSATNDDTRNINHGMVDAITSPTSHGFGNSNNNPSTFGSRRTSNSTAFTAHRAAIIRQHHPLASSTVAARRRDRQTAPHHQSHGGIARRATKAATSSCASQSTRKSKRTGSSRNYWDLGGSVGSGPTGVGAWGDVSV